MSLSDDINLLKQVHLFAGFNDDQLRLLAFGAQHKNAGSGVEIFHNGAQSDSGYVIVSGEIDFIPQKLGPINPRPVRHGRLTLLSPVSLITKGRHVGTVVTVTDVEYLRISRDVFMRMLDEYPELASVMHERIANMVEETIRELERVRSRLV